MNKELSMLLKSKEDTKVPIDRLLAKSLKNKKEDPPSVPPSTSSKDKQSEKRTSLSKLPVAKFSAKKLEKTRLPSSVSNNSKVGDMSVKENRNSDQSRLNASAQDHGYMPGHHIPDGTAYSQRSDYAHMDHKGQSREDVAGVDDVGLAESRGFDILRHTNRNLSNSAVDRGSINKPRSVSACVHTKSFNSESNKTSSLPIRRDNIEKVNNVAPVESNVRDILAHTLRSLHQSTIDRYSVDKHNSTNSNVTDKPTYNHEEIQSSLSVSQKQNDDSVFSVESVSSEGNSENSRNAETQTHTDTRKKLESWTQTSLVLKEGLGKICPIEAPGVLKFQEACCVGISRKEILPLKNPTDRWMECIIQVWLCVVKLS